MKNIWSIAGSDSSGASGIQADMKTISAFGLHGCSLLTSVTAQSSYGLLSQEPVSLSLLTSQWNALSQDLTPSAIKIGLIPTKEILNFVSEKINEASVPVICDPVFKTSSSQNLHQEDFFDDYVNHLLPKCEVVTPNLIECERITGRKIKHLEEMETASKELNSLGISSFYLKGGHLVSDHAIDLCKTPQFSFWLKTKRHPLKKTRGTGCTLSSAIACAFAMGHPLEDAFVLAKTYISRALRKSTITYNL
jgi:hydroxymethylpyrimidine kinase/phosphomethylpyrimidine kinase